MRQTIEGWESTVSYLFSGMYVRGVPKSVSTYGTGTVRRVPVLRWFFFSFIKYLSDCRI